MLDAPFVLQETTLFTKGTSHRITISRRLNEITYMTQQSKLAQKKLQLLSLRFTLGLLSLCFLPFYSDMLCDVQTLDVKNTKMLRLRMYCV